MSIVLYVVRNKLDPSLFYKSRSKNKNGGSGWVNDIYGATIYSRLTGPSQVVKNVVGENVGEIVPIHGQVQSGDFKLVYVIKNIKTGMYLANKGMRAKKKLHTDKFYRAGSWTNSGHAKHVLNVYSKHRLDELRINKSEYKILSLPVFIQG